MTKTKAQLEDEIKELKKEVLRYKEGMKDVYKELYNVLDGKDAVSREDYERLKNRHEKELKLEQQHYDELRKQFEAQAAELASLQERLKHNARGAGRKAKLTHEIMQQIKEMRVAGATYADMAEALNLAVGTVYKAANSKIN